MTYVNKKGTPKHKHKLLYSAPDNPSPLTLPFFGDTMDYMSRFSSTYPHAHTRVHTHVHADTLLSRTTCTLLRLKIRDWFSFSGFFKFVLSYHCKYKIHFAFSRSSLQSTSPLFSLPSLLFSCMNFI